MVSPRQASLYLLWSRLVEGGSFHEVHLLEALLTLGVVTRARVGVTQHLVRVRVGVKVWVGVKVEVEVEVRVRVGTWVGLADL